MCAGYSGAGAEYPGYQTMDHTGSYTGGLTEEEQLETAIRNSLNDRGKREKGGLE